MNSSAAKGEPTQWGKRLGRKMTLVQGNLCLKFPPKAQSSSRRLAGFPKGTAWPVPSLPHHPQAQCSLGEISRRQRGAKVTGVLEDLTEGFQGGSRPPCTPALVSVPTRLSAPSSHPGLVQPPLPAISPARHAGTKGWGVASRATRRAS